MARFFIKEHISGDFLLEDENARHAVKSLRIRKGETLVLCDGKKQDFICEVKDVYTDSLMLSLIEAVQNKAEANVKVTLYQCLPKADKMELIVQKAVELGVTEIVPVVSSRCIANYSGKEDKKVGRFNKISLEAAKQCGRGIIPNVAMPIKFEEAVKTAKGTKIFCYENGGEHFKNILNEDIKEVSILIGSEGGFSEEEAKLASENGFTCASLGKRILRTETAGLSALSIIMYELD